MLTKRVEQKAVALRKEIKGGIAALSGGDSAAVSQKVDGGFIV